MNWNFLRRNHGSITTRLILSLTIVTTLLWCSAAALATYASYRELNGAFDAALRETALRLLPLAADDVLGHESDDSRAIARLMEHREAYLGYQLRNAWGQVLLRSGAAPTAPFDTGSASGFSTVADYRLYRQTDPSNGLTITVTEPIHNRLEAVVGSIRAMTWPLLALVPMNVLAIWLSVRGAMTPVSRLKEDIASRGSTNLTPLDISDQPKELRPIAEAIARLVERLRNALDAERALAANSAHELRTPIAGALAQTQRLIAELHGTKGLRRAKDIEGTLKRLSRLSEKLIQLSRIDAGIGLCDEPIDLVPVLELVVVDASASLNSPERLVYIRSDDACLAVRMDTDAFAMVVRNLIDNAVVHGPGDGRIEVRLETGGTIRFINEGPVVPPGVLAELTKRFTRGRTDVGGSGLGLAIVETITKQSGGRLRLFSPPPDRKTGFEARLQLKNEA